MTPTELWLSREPRYLDLPQRLETAKGWDLSIHWTQRAVYARKGDAQLCVPFESCIIRYTGETPKGPGRPEKPSGP